MIAARAQEFASLVKLSHSVFALPFALLSLLAATAGGPSLHHVAFVVLAVVAARTAAMAYNRYADRAIDARNPRTAGRELPRGVISPRAALAFTGFSAVVFLLSCWQLSALCFWLGWPTLAWLLGYSHVKTFSTCCHLWLGLALGLSPVAAWLAVDGEFGPRLVAPLVLGLAVAAWVAGFDILYACQDEAFDRHAGLFSIPARFGARRAMRFSRILHAGAVVGFFVFGRLVPLGPAFSAGVGLAAVLLAWQHRLLRPDDLSRIQAAFFTANGTIAVSLLGAGCLDLYWLQPLR